MLMLLKRVVEYVQRFSTITRIFVHDVQLKRVDFLPPGLGSRQEALSLAALLAFTGASFWAKAACPSPFV